MTTNQEGRQAAIRESTSTAYGVAADWHALFDDAGISAGTFNERLLAWINDQLGTSYSNLLGAMAAYAADAGYNAWSSISTLVLGGASTLLSGETDGLAFDFTDSSARIKDTSTPANEYSSTGIVSSGSLVGPSGKLTYTSPSNKLTMQSDVYYKYQAHNLATYSEEISSWTAFNVSTIDASYFLESSATNYHGPYSSITSVAGAQYKFVVEVKGINRDWCVLEFSSSAVSFSYFNISGDGALGTIDGGHSGASITKLSDGYYRLEVTVTASSATLYYEVFSATGDGVGSFAGNTSSGLYIRKAHVCRYPANSDYIRTTSAAKYALPLEYDTSGNCLGLLVEEAKTNPVTYSAQFDNAAWTKTRSTISANAAVAPNGLLHADKLVEDNSLAASHYTQQTVTVSGTTTYTASVYAKAGEKSWICMTSSGAGGGNSHFDLANGSVGTVTTTSAAIEDVGNGWYRCSHTWTTGAIASSAFQIYIAEADNDITFDGDSSSGVYLWGAQVEAGSFPTSPIITYGSTSTRAADTISIATSAFPHSATAGSVYYQGAFVGVSTASTLRPWTLCDGTTSEVIAGGYVSSSPSFIVNDGGVSQVSISVGSISDDVTYKHASAWEANNFNAAKDGAVGTLDTSGTLPTVTTLYIGSRESALSHANGYIKALSYVPRRKTDAELQAETT